MENVVERLVEWGMLYGPRIIGAVAILVLGRWFAAVLTNFVIRLMKRSGADPTLSGFVRNLTKVTLLAFVFIAALGALGVDTTSMIAVIGAAGLAVGFALQSSLSNIASGIMLILFKPFKADDYVEVAGVSGVVEEIRIFSTVLRTVDNRQIIVPNSGITGGSIINYSAKQTRRIDLVFGIGYGDDLKKAKDILQKILAEEERILKEPAADIGIAELADSSVNFYVRPWVKAVDYWPVRAALLEKTKLTFDREGISIPFPQQDVHLHQVASI